MRKFVWTLGLLTLIFVFQEFLCPVEGVRVRVVKVKKTRHDKRQATPQRGGYSDVDEGYDGGTAGGSQNLRPQDNPFNAGNRKVDYPINTNLGGSSSNNNRQNQFNSNNNFGGFNNNQQNINRRPSSGSTSSKGFSTAVIGGQPSNQGNYDGDEHCDGCGNGIPGEPGTDYPIFASLPKTNFDCKKQQWPGYYADIESRCQVFWICQKNRADAFLCPNGTMFNQQVFVCDWWFNVDCNLNAEYYSRNQYIYGGPGIDIAGNPIAIRAQEQTNFNLNPSRVTNNQFVNANPTTRRPVVQSTILNSQASFVNNPSSNTGNAHRVGAGYQTGSSNSAIIGTEKNSFVQTKITQTTSTSGNQEGSGSSNYNRRATNQGNNSNQGYSQGSNVKYNREVKGYSDIQETGDRLPAAATPTPSYAFENNNRKPVQNGFLNSPRPTPQKENGYIENSHRAAAAQSEFSKNNGRPNGQRKPTEISNDRSTNQSSYSKVNEQRQSNQGGNKGSVNQDGYTYKPPSKSYQDGYTTTTTSNTNNAQRNPSNQGSYSPKTPTNSNQDGYAYKPSSNLNQGGYSPKTPTNQNQDGYAYKQTSNSNQAGYSSTSQRNSSNQSGYASRTSTTSNQDGYTYKPPSNSNQGGYSSTSSTNNAQRNPSNQGGYSSTGSTNNAQRNPSTQGGYTPKETSNQDGYTYKPPSNQGAYSSTSNSRKPSNHGEYSSTTNTNKQNTNQGGYSPKAPTNTNQDGYSYKPNTNQGGYSPKAPTNLNQEGYTYTPPTNQGGYSGTSKANIQRSVSPQGAFSNTNEQSTPSKIGYSTEDVASSKNNDQRQSHVQNPFLSQTPRPSTKNNHELEQKQRNPNNYSIKNSQYYQPTYPNPFLPKNLQDQQRSASTNNPIRYTYTSTIPAELSTTTTKRSILDSDSDVEYAANDPPVDDNFDDVFAFNFAKTIVPTKSSYKIQTRRAYDIKDVPNLEITTLKPPTSTSLQSPHPHPHQKEVEIQNNDLNGRHSHDQPLAFLQAPAPLHHHTDLETQTPAPTFGKKIKSGRKRNTSNWTSYFHKN